MFMCSEDLEFLLAAQHQFYLIFVMVSHSIGDKFQCTLQTKIDFKLSSQFELQQKCIRTSANFSDVIQEN